MRFIPSKERHRRMRAEFRAAWETTGHTAQDPGLRERYQEIPRAPIRLIACPLQKSVNHGGLLRVAEAFRIAEVHFSPEADGAMDFSGHRGTQATQPWKWLPAPDSIAEARAAGFQVVAVTLSDRAVSFDQFAYRFPLALVFGAELDGIPAEWEAECDAAVAIPLYGLVTSLNVATAAAIVVQHAQREYARSHPEFRPARAASQRLVDTEPRDGRSSE